MEAPNIRGVLAKQKLQDAAKTLLEKLRADGVSEQRPDLVERLAVSHNGDIAASRRPGALPSRRTVRGAAGRPRPTGPAHNLR
jgi:hypothetical protein